MRVVLATPSADPRTGNGTTARRWARLLRELGHRVRVTKTYDGSACDLLIALHARKCAAAVSRSHRARPARPIVVGLSGTDIYRGAGLHPEARRSLELAARLIALQPLAIAQLPAALRARVRVVHQSVGHPPRRGEPLRSAFEVVVVANLRAVKDPLRAAMAARDLPPGSRIRVTHAGLPLDRRIVQRAQREMARNPRYRWIGPATHSRVLRLLARSPLCCLTSKSEGGANLVSEALAVRTPIVASRIPGSVGILGEDYPGYFPVGDTRALGALLREIERDPALRRRLASRCRELRPLVAPSRERRAWRKLLEELAF